MCQPWEVLKSIFQFFFWFRLLRDVTHRTKQTKRGIVLTADCRPSFGRHHQTCCKQSSQNAALSQQQFVYFLSSGFPLWTSNTDYRHLVAWRRISCHAGAQRMRLLAVVCCLRDVFKCSFLAVTQAKQQLASSLMLVWWVKFSKSFTATKNV